jgi:hypothetical protein
MEPLSVFIVHYNGKLYEIKPRPYEPERMTADVAWIQIREGVPAEEAYRIWFERQRRISRVLQQ